MHHMTANWCPIGREERNQLCLGVWATLGSTGPLARGREHVGARRLGRAWPPTSPTRPAAAATRTRRWPSGGRPPRRCGAVASTASSCPPPGPGRSSSWSPTACAARCTPTSWSRVPPGTSGELLDAVGREGSTAVAAARARAGRRLRGGHGRRLRGAAALGDPRLGDVGRLRAGLGARRRAGRRGARRSSASGRWRRQLLVDAPLSPLRTGRQPAGVRPPPAGARSDGGERARPAVITDDGIDRLRARINVPEPWPQPPHHRVITTDTFRHVAEAYGDDNPLWCDPAYGADHPVGRADRAAAAGRRRHARRRRRGHRGAARPDRRSCRAIRCAACTRSTRRARASGGRRWCRACRSPAATRWSACSTSPASSPSGRCTSGRPRCSAPPTVRCCRPSSAT